MATSTPIPSAVPSASSQMPNRFGKSADDASLGPLAFLQLLQDVQSPQQMESTVSLQQQNQLPSSAQDAAELSSVPDSEQAQAMLLPWLQKQDWSLLKQEPQLSASSMTRADETTGMALPLEGNLRHSRTEALVPENSSDVWAAPEQAVFMHTLNGTQSSVGSDAVTASLPQGAIGHTLATVAAGVQSMETLSAQQAQLMAGKHAVGLAAGMSHWMQSTSDVVSQMTGDVPLEATGDSPVILQDGWQLDDGGHSVPPLAMQRMVGQIEQWVAANAGWLPARRLSEQAGSSSHATGQAVTPEYAAGASGTRLMDVAVQEAQQVADTAMPDAQSEAFTEKLAENMRFWLQGRQQRAEVTLDRNGQSVRVQVLLDGNEAHVTFHSDQAQTRDLLDAGLSQLRDMLAQQGVELAGVSVQEQTTPQGQAQWTDNPQLSRALGSGRMRQAQVVVPDTVVDGRSAVMQRSMNGLDIYA